MCAALTTAAFGHLISPWRGGEIESYLIRAIPGRDHHERFRDKEGGWYARILFAHLATMPRGQALIQWLDKQNGRHSTGDVHSHVDDDDRNAMVVSPVVSRWLWLG